MKPFTSIAIALVDGTTSLAVIPGQASDISHTITMVGFLAATECFVSDGHGTQEEADEITRDTLIKRLYLKPAYTWLTTTPNGHAAIQATSPYLTDDCSNLTASEEEIRELIMPFIK
jgi:hypothetical protein